MKLSANGAYQNPQKAGGFEPYSFSDAASLARIVKKSDHCPSVFSGDRRLNSEFVSCDFLFIDVDSGISILDFCNHRDFADRFYIILTSKSHRKEKKGVTCDRFHVLLPVQTITSEPELAEKLTRICRIYHFADKSAKGAARYWNGNKETEIIWHEGKEYQFPSEPDKFEDDLPYDDKPIVTKQPRQQACAKWNGQRDDKKTMMMDALLKLASTGGLASYQDYIDVGMAMRADGGFDFADWHQVLSAGKPADSDTLADAEYKWGTFSPTQITGATLMHYCRQAVPELLVKGSMPPQPKIKIGPRQEKAKGFSTDAPTTLETEVPPDRVKEVYEKITWLSQDSHGNDVRKLSDGWYLILLDLDAELANCAKHDYTVGGPTISYSNTEILKTAIRRRVRAYGVPERAVTDTVVSRIYDEIIHANRFHNRVLAFTKDLQRNFPVQDEGLLDEFLSFLEFQPPGEHEPWSAEHIRKMYREIFHLFFLRMHLHIQGTAMVNDGGYYGLMTNDIVPVLGGSQEIGKTTLCQWLACNREDMYVDLGSGGKSSMFGTADTVRQVRGRMIAELGEMKIMRDSANVEAVKSFISKTKYELDVKYVEHSEPLPSTVSYIGTSNPEEYLSDVTGNRRFFPVKLKSIDLSGLARNRDLACRLHSYYATLAESIPIEERFDQCRQSAELREFVGAKRDEAMITYSDHGAIIEVVNKAFLAEKYESNRVDGVHKIQNHEIEKLITDAGYRIIVTKNSIISAMEGLGYQYRVMKIDGLSRRVWAKNYNSLYKKA